MKRDELSIIKDQIRNSFWGGVIGDALGTPIEFVDFEFVENFGPITTYLNNRKREIVGGMYSDDTCMTLALMDSLSNKKKINLRDQMTRYCNWLNNGEYTCAGYSYGSGRVTREAVQYFVENGKFRDNSGIDLECGNGSLMRTAPIVWWTAYNIDKNKCLELCDLCSTPTHNHILCRYVCKMFGSMLYDILNGVKNKRQLIDNMFNDVLCNFQLRMSKDYYNYSELLKIVDTDYVKKYDPYLLYKLNRKFTGYAPVTLMCALWAFLTTNTFEDGMIRAINIPGDCDTIGSVYGQLAGAYYLKYNNKTNKPIHQVNQMNWFNGLQNKDYLKKMINSFLQKLKDEQ